jgi:CheY-like chemotaxis protein
VRVLVVDDLADAADSLALLLRFQGVEARTAYDGLSALNAAEEFAPRVVLLDLGLPGLNGWEVARRLKALEKPPFVCAVSGHVREEDRQKSAAAGVDLHLAKPVEPGFIIKLLQSLRATG